MNQDQQTAGTSADHLSKEKLQGDMAAGRGTMAKLAQSATAAGKAQLDSGLVQAAGQVDQIAKAVDDAASRLKDEHQEGLAAYAGQFASSISSLAERLRERSVDDLANDARQLARSNPALFLAGSVAVGFGLTRFMKASARVSEATGSTRDDRYGSSYGDSRNAGGPYGDSRDSLDYASATDTSAGGTYGAPSATPRSGAFPEMGSTQVNPDGSVGGSRTNQLSGGSHG